MYLGMRYEYGVDKFYLPEDNMRRCEELKKLTEMNVAPMISGVNKPFEIPGGEWKVDPNDI